MSESDEDFMPSMMTSTFSAADIQRRQYNMRGFDQRSMYYRRETSPMSLRSFPNSGMQNYRSSFHNRGMSSQRSMINGRSGSPMSIRTIDSNASVSAVDIALAFQNNNFDKYDLRIIKEAYKKYFKSRVRKRYERRKNLKLFLKNNRQNSGDEGSDSSISSDGCGSTRTVHRDNFPMAKKIRPDLSNFRKTIKESNMFNDCTETIKQNSLKNMLAVNSKLSHNQTSYNKLSTNTSSFTLKDRFTKGASFVLPAQRFDRSLAKPPSNQTLNNYESNNINRNKSAIDKTCESDSEKEEIFSEISMRENIQHTATSQLKRPLDTEENNALDRKRKKMILSPIKQNSDFNFKMPQMPARKSSNIKKVATDIVIAQSHQPLTESLNIPINTVNVPEPIIIETNQGLNTKSQDLSQNGTEKDDSCNQKDVTISSDVSSRPSFIKRKLFSQKLDVVEKKNNSSDSLGVNSPQTKLYRGCGEKNKVRKLVTSQSCLSRDVGENNVLDLIHKIIPPDQMNITNTTNKRASSKSNRDSNDKWDVTSIISMCNDNDGSDTYTDEEIFKAPTTIQKNTPTEDVNKINENAVKLIGTAIKPKQSDTTKNKTQCKVVLQKIQPAVMNTITDHFESDNTKCQNKRTVSDCVRSFWDTDFESDMEDRPETPRKSKHQANLGNDVFKNITVNSSNFNSNNRRNVNKGKILSEQNIENKGLNINKFHVSQTSKLTETHCNTNQETINSSNNTQKIDTKTRKINSVANDQDKLKSKPKKDVTNEKKNKNEKKNPKSANNKKKNINDNTEDKNTSKESVRLKEKREKANLSADASKPKKGRPKKSLENIDKNTSKINNKTKKKSNKDVKAVKSLPIKNTTLKKTRQSPRKCNRSQTSSMDQSSLNVSNISTRSMRLRQKAVK